MQYAMLKIGRSISIRIRGWLISYSTSNAYYIFPTRDHPTLRSWSTLMRNQIFWHKSYKFMTINTYYIWLYILNLHTYTYKYVRAINSQLLNKRCNSVLSVSAQITEIALDIVERKANTLALMTKWLLYFH